MSTDPVPPAGASPETLLAFLERAARSFPTLQGFCDAYTGAHLLDLSNRACHRVGRAIPVNPPGAGDLEMLDLDAMQRSGRQGECGIGRWSFGDPRYRHEVEALFGPSRTVAIHRGVPRGVAAIDIGDWVALDPAYAADSGEINNRSWHVVSLVVPKTDVVWDNNDAKEWVYSPRSLRARAVSLRTIWERANLRAAA